MKSKQVNRQHLRKNRQNYKLPTQPTRQNNNMSTKQEQVFPIKKAENHSKTSGKNLPL